MIYRRRKIPKIIIVFSLLFILTFSVYLSGRIFYTSRIDCYTQFGICSNQITSSLTWLYHRPLLRPIPRQDIKSQLSQFSEISDFHTYRRLPDTLVIGVVLRQPIGLISSSVLGAKTAVDEQGYVFSSASVSGLPVLINSGMKDLPARLNQDETRALQIMSELSSELTGEFMGELQGETLTIIYPGSIRVLVDTGKSVSSWSSSLHLILARSKIMAKLPRSIDLRFTNPVITY